MMLVNLYNIYKMVICNFSFIFFTLIILNNIYYIAALVYITDSIIIKYVKLEKKTLKHIMEIAYVIQYFNIFPIVFFLFPTWSSSLHPFPLIHLSHIIRTLIHLSRMKL